MNLHIPAFSTAYLRWYPGCRNTTTVILIISNLFLKRIHLADPLIITDGIFALTGEIAPLADIHSLAEKYGALYYRG